MGNYNYQFKQKTQAECEAVLSAHFGKPIFITIFNSKRICFNDGDVKTANFPVEKIAGLDNLLKEFKDNAEVY